LNLYPIIGGPEDVPVCDYLKLRCILARGTQDNCAPGDECKKLLDKLGYKLAGDTWVCKSCGVPFGSNIHALSCGIAGPGAK
jgi:hypothetical protein